MRCLVFLVLLAVLTSTASAYVISDIDVWIGEDGFSWIEEKIVFRGDGESGRLQLPALLDDISVSDSRGDLDYNLSEVEGRSEVKIYFREYLEEGDETTVSLKYGTHHLTKKEESVWSFRYQTPATARKTIVRVTYPVGAQILTLKPEDLLRTYVRNGVWLYPQEDYFNLSTTYRYGGVKPDLTTTTTTLAKENGGGLILDAEAIILVGVVIIVLVVLGALFTIYKDRLMGKGNGSMTVNVAEDVVSDAKVVDGKVTYDIEGSTSDKGDKTVKESVLKMLEDSELAIVKLLENSEEEEITQAYIYKTTGIPKSSLSDILKRLEKRNIIERRVSGRVKWIKLKDWIID
ncbi:MAG: MarR family transcriptional regulator [Candidatus Altiarchaeales archaeon]|nr:MarR family transcriptional regulator [Candidatus Altiarchaeales archaeon]MBD3416965.1 MarR family transcriptional regulator [Candidatus Altiarchaeales archaeon]